MKHWLIRSLFITLLLLCVGVWGWSYCFCEAGQYLRVHASEPPIAWSATISGGKVFLMEFEPVSAEMDPLPMGWTCYHWRQDTYEQNYERKLDTWPGLRFIGFHVLHEPDLPLPPGRPTRGIQIPLWFASMFSALTLLYAWRKTRPKPNPATAFPVEMDKMPA